MALERGIKREGSIRINDFPVQSHTKNEDDDDEGEMGFSLCLRSDSNSCLSEITDMQESIGSFSRLTSTLSNSTSNVARSDGFHLATPKTPWSMKGRRHVFVMPSLTERGNSMIGDLPIVDRKDDELNVDNEEEASFSYRSYLEEEEEDYDIAMPEDVIQEEESIVEEDVFVEEELVDEVEEVYEESIGNFALSDSALSFETYYSQQKQNGFSSSWIVEEPTQEKDTRMETLQRKNKYVHLMAQIAALDSNFLSSFGVQPNPKRSISASLARTRRTRCLSTGSISMGERIFAEEYILDDHTNMYPLRHAQLGIKSVTQTPDPCLQCQILLSEIEVRRTKLKDAF